MQITREEARRIAVLAHLRFDDAALDRMADEMTNILSYIEQLASAPLLTTPAAAPAVAASVLRNDEAVPGLDRDTVAASWNCRGRPRSDR